MTTQECNRWLLRAAGQLHHFYLNRSRDQVQKRLQQTDLTFDCCLADVRRAERQLSLAARRGLTLCQRRLKSRYELALAELSHRVESVQRQWGEPWPHTPSQRELYEELLATEEEFGAVEYVPREKIIAVHTEGIVLEGIPLGPFRIVLELPRITGSPPADWYVVEALDPNPAGTNEEIVHPHVDGDRLCAGDGLVPITNALAQGRLCDFFVLVRSVLQTYNPHSAYVELESWDGIACHDCGYTMSSDNSYYCEICEHDYCDECMSMCEICNMGYCRNCLKRPELSNMCVCESCCRRCDACERLGTIDELEDDLCPECREQTAEDKDNNHDDNQQDNDTQESPQPQEGDALARPVPTHAGAEVLRPGVAQTPVPLPGR